MIENILEFGIAVSGEDYILRPGSYLVVLNSQGEVAVVSTPQGFFLPGGGQNNGETPAQAAVREADEECGLRVELGEMLGTADELVFAAAETKYYRKRCVFFSARFIRCEEGGEEEHQLIWLKPEDAVSLLSHKSQAWAVMR